MSSRGNLFAIIENEFEFADRSEVIERTKAAFYDLCQALIDAQVDGEQGVSGQTLAAILLAAGRYGVEGKNELNAGEKQAADAVFGLLAEATESEISMEDVYRELAGPVTDNDRGLLGALAEPGFGMSTLRLILGFAYADGAIGDAAAEELESIFGMALVSDFVHSGLESASPHKIRVSPLEKQIADWIEEEDGVYTLDNVCEHFPGQPRGELERALDALVDKGFLFTLQTFLGKAYAKE